VEAARSVRVRSWHFTDCLTVLLDWQEVDSAYHGVMTTEISLSQRCVRDIVELIRRKELKAGQRLGEVAMARRLKIGRAPVRVAFDDLARAGLLERIARSGTFVRRVTLQEWCELMDLRAALESMAARLACKRLNPVELEKLAQVAKRLDQRSGRLYAQEVARGISAVQDEELVQLEREFHYAIATASGNHKIIELLENHSILENLFLMGQTFPPRRMPPAEGIPDHAAVVKSLRSGDPDAASDTMLKHLLLSKEQFVSNVVGL
jgi:DNA-binding GntR family transcriptional regulator